jgi:hypothetical protein
VTLHTKNGFVEPFAGHKAVVSGRFEAQSGSFPSHLRQHTYLATRAADENQPAQGPPGTDTEGELPPRQQTVVGRESRLPRSEPTVKRRD